MRCAKEGHTLTVVVEPLDRVMLTTVDNVLRTCVYVTEMDGKLWFEGGGSIVGGVDLGGGSTIEVSVTATVDADETKELGS